MSSTTTHDAEPAADPAASTERPARRDLAAAATRESARAKLFGAHARRRVELGRYVVERRIGAGAMGEVFLAHDPKLDRKVALKLVVPTATTSPHANARLLREARALAQLDHPNTVPVHDVGTEDDRVWIAMEFIDGCTLREWCRAQRRSIAAIVEVFGAAGRGLAAAHAEGLLHRDFKPDNVMVAPADAERPTSVRVTDFGLAAPVGAYSTGLEPDTAEAIGRDRTLTRAGSLQGTPGYIAPELLEGARADAASDQFAFCVSLYEVLFEARPFGGITPQEILRATRAGEIERHASTRRVPRWLRRVVLRGLRPSPHDRFASMEAIVHELERDRSRVRFGVAFGLGATALAGAVIAAQPEPCAPDPTRVDGVWDSDRREATRAAFMATRLPYAEDAFVSVATRLDAWVEQWSAARVDACEATHVRGEQSERLLDLRIACLDAHLVEVQALTAAFAEGGAEVVRRAPQSAASLPAFARCADAKALESSVGAIEDPIQAADAALAQHHLAEQHAWAAVGRFDAAAEAAKAAMEAAERSGHGPTRAEALASAGTLAFEKGDVDEGVRLLTEAVWEAEASGHDRLAGFATARLVTVVGYQLDKPERGMEWADHAAALLRRIGGDPLVEADIHKGIGIVHDGQGRFAEARVEYEKALTLLREALGDDALGVADVLGLVAGTHLSEDDVAASEGPYADALAIYERTLGKHHPDYATAVGNLGIVALEAGRIEDARARLQEALDILVPAVGPDHYDALILRNNMVRLELQAGDLVAARELATKNVADSSRVFGDRHPDTLRARGTLAQVLEAQGDVAGAVKILEDAIAAGGNEAILEMMREHLESLRAQLPSSP